MADISKLRQHALALEARLRVLHQTDTGELRQLTPDQQREFDTVAADLAATRDSIDKHAAILELAKNPGNVVHPNGAPSLIRSPRQPWITRDARDGDEARAAAVGSLERLGATDGAIERIANVLEEESAIPAAASGLARRITACADPHYLRAFGKLLADPLMGHNRFTSAERSAWDNVLEATEARTTLQVGSNPTGGYAVPTMLDPTIILTNAGSTNVLREISRVVSLPYGNTWHGVSSAGVTASFDAELQEVSDDSPTFAGPAIPVWKAQAFVGYSIEAGEDIGGSLTSELGRLFADARDRLEEAAFSTGNGTSAPKGVWTALTAATASQVVSTTAATIGLVDLQTLYRSVPGRSRRRSTWLMHPNYSLAIRALGTAVSASYSGDLRDETDNGAIFGRPVRESDEAPSTQTTTALDQEVLLGDFSNFVIVDKVGLSVEPIPHLFSTANNLPSGARGLYAHWRVGSDVVNTLAFRVLCDKTTA